MSKLNDYGLKVHNYSRIIFPVSPFDGSLWCSKYSCTISSVIFPVDHPPYPIAQKCLPQYRFFSFGNSSCKILDDLPFSFFTRLLIDNLAGYSMCICTWSLLTTPFSIRTSSASQVWISSSLHLLCTSPLNTGYRYFVTHTKCTINMVTACPVRLCSFIVQHYHNCVAAKALH